MNGFTFLDLHTIERILQYLEEDERKEIFDVCSVLHEYKREFFLYRLNREYSRQYWKCVSFREKIHACIRSKRQLALDLSFTPDIYSVTPSEGFDGLYELDLSSCCYLKRVKISNIHSLILRRCKKLKKVKISHVDVMNISSSYYIRSHFYTWRKLKHLILSILQYELCIRKLDYFKNVEFTFEKFSIREYMDGVDEKGPIEIVLAENVRCAHL